MRVQVVALTSAISKLGWSSSHDRSNLFVNMGGGMRAFEGSRDSYLFPGAPTFGEFSWIPPGPAFVGSYGRGEIRFLEISVGPDWQAPAYPRLAAFDLHVVRSARAIAALARGNGVHSLEAPLGELWAYLLHHHSEKPGAMRRGAALTDHSFELVQRRILRAPSAIRTTAELAEQTGTTLDGLNRTFQARTGMSAAGFLGESRLRAARRMLTQTSIPLAQIAFRSGFSSQSHLTDRMRQRLGVTPARLRHVLTHWRADEDRKAESVRSRSP